MAAADLRTRNDGKSVELMQKARRYSPGGVHSHIRSYLTADIVLERAEGAYLWDVDGNRYIDYNAAFAATILGHCHAAVDEAVIKGIRRLDLTGLGSNESEIALAEKVVEHVPSADLAAICNTGSEATYHAIRLSRAVTNRTKIIKFEGHYHGWHDYLLMNVATTKEMLGQKTLLSAGMLPRTVDETTVLPFNDVAAVEKSLRTKDYAAVIVEPIAHNMGCVMPTEAFIDTLRTTCDETGTILIFDEIITGFRHSLGGYQEILGVLPDLTTLGKAVSNGYPCAVVCGKRELMMELTTGGGSVYFSGTHNAHPAGTVAATATISELEDGRVYDHLFELGDYIQRGLEDISSRLGIPMYVAGYGSIFVPYFMDPELGPPQRYSDLLETDLETDQAFRTAMVERGIVFYPRPTRRICLTAAHTREDVDETLQIAEDVLRDLQ